MAGGMADHLSGCKTGDIDRLAHPHRRKNRGADGAAGLLGNRPQLLPQYLSGIFMRVAAGVALAVLTEFLPGCAICFPPLSISSRRRPSPPSLFWPWSGSGPRACPPSCGAHRGAHRLGKRDRGHRNVDSGFLEMAEVFEFGRAGSSGDLSAFGPALFMAACTTSAGLAWKAGIAAEVLGRPACPSESRFTNPKFI